MNAPARTPEPGWPLGIQLLGLCLLIGLPLVVLLGYNLYRNAEYDKRQAGAGALYLARIGAQNTESFLAEARAMLETLARRPSVLALDRKACDPLLGDIPKLYPRFRNALTVDRDGNLVCSAVTATAATPAKPNPVYWFNRVRDSMRFTIGMPALGFITKRWVVTLAYPLRNARGEFIGAVGLPVDLVDYPVLPTMTGLPPETLTGIASYAGTIIARSQDAPNFVGRSSLDSPIRAAALATTSGYIETTGMDGVSRVYGFTPIPGSEWYALAGIPATVVYAESRAVARLNLLLALAVLSLVSVLAYVVGRRIERPLRRIAATANAVAAGDRAARAPCVGSREAVVLGSRFNAMLEALDASDRQVRETLDNIHLIGVGLDERGNVTYCNDYLLELSGWRRDELLGQNWFVTVLPDPAPVLAVFEQGIREGNLPLHYENEIVTRLGEHRLIRWNNTILRDSAQQIRGAISLGEDITESRRAQTALQESEARLGMALEATGIGIWDWDITRDQWYASPTYFTMLGYLPEAGPSDRTVWLNRLHPDDRQHVADKIGDVLRGDDASYGYEARMRRADGAWRWVAVLGRVVERDMHGKVSRMRGIRMDITERKRLEERNREQFEEQIRSEARYRQLFEYAPDGILITDSESHCLDVNSSLCQMLGYRRDELIGLHASNIVAETEIEHIRPALNQIKARADYHREWRFRRKDGAVLVTDVSATLMPDGNVLGVVRDITEYKRARAALEKMQNLLAESERIGKVGGWEFDIDTQKQTWTEEVYRIHEVDDAYEPTVEQGVNFYTPASRPKIEQAVRRAIKHGESFDVELEIITAKGNLRIVHAIGKTDMQHRKVFGSFQDITERKLAERLLDGQKRVLELVAVKAPLPDALAALTSVIESQSPGMLCSILLLDADGVHIRHGAAPSLPEEFIQAVDGSSIGPRAGSCGTAAYRGEQVVVENIDTDPLWQDYRHLAELHGLRACWSTPIFDARRRVLGTFAMYFLQPGRPTAKHLQLIEIATQTAAIAIVSKRGEMEILMLNAELEQRVAERTAQLEAAKIRAEAADRVKSAFLATMSHELRTPLNSIIGFTGILQQKLPGPLNAEQEKQLAIVRNASRHLLTLINDVLDISKVEAGELHLASERVDLHAQIARLGGVFAALAERRGLAFALGIGKGEAIVTCDARRVEQVLNNLLSNALKFTQRGNIELGCVRANDTFTIAVTDTGVGIKSEDMDKLFHPFSQIETGLPELREGAGLGLAISKHLVEAMGGHIFAESVWGKGSRFVFTLPAGGQL
ncbi:MAG: PAS domain S-box protein [Betaproteobacteria bacterium]|nr:PAS domain S-box protein [Betaproteobacteria bacterium]